MVILAQPSPFEVWQQTVREQFRSGGSWTSVFVVVLLFAGLVIVVGWLTRIQNRLQQRREDAPQYSDPQRLYAHLLSNLGLTVPQRQMLDAVAHDLHLPHPTAMLISEVLFDRCFEQWMREAKGGAAAVTATTSQLVARTRKRLFPEGAGMVFSMPTRA